jgi:predicted SnoaL-like aldol condensation-catalyzing enzyme
MLSNKEKIRILLKGIETGDPEAAKVVNENKYIQHNPHTQEGNIGLAALFKQIAKTGPQVNMIRVLR